LARSMTGFGRAEGRLPNGAKIIVEIRSLNHRYFNCNYKMPDILASRAGELEAELKKEISRGSLQYNLHIEGEERLQEIVFNASVLERYYRLLEASARRLKVSEPLRLELVALLPGVASLREKREPSILWRTVLETTRKALRNLLAMRSREGKAILKDLSGCLTRMVRHLGAVSKRAPVAVEASRRKFCRRVRALLAGAASDRDPEILKEAALFAQRSDFSEEIARLREHLRQMRRLLASAGPSGRKIEFLAQEMHREVNTMASKSSDMVASRHILELKSEVEKIRQQAMNLE